MLILDTGAIVAAFDVNDPWYERCDFMLQTESGPLLIPTTVLVEVDYLLHNRAPFGAWEAFYADLEDGQYTLEHVTVDDFERTLELRRTYEYMGLQIADASVVAVCERLGQTRVGTIDRRDFRRIKPSHCDEMELLPGGGDDP